MPATDKGLLLLAWFLMAAAAALLRVMPFRRLAPLLGVPIGAVAFVPIASKKQVVRAHMVRCAILRAAHIAPFRSDCLPQALVAAALCRMLDVPTSIHLGIRLNDGQRDMAAHAWVCSVPEAATGGRSFGADTAVACFLSSNLGRTLNAHIASTMVG